jgi:transposase-like protein
MKDRKAKTALKVVHRNDRAQIKRVLAGSGQALLPMLELLEGAQASIDELMHETAVALVEQLLVLSAQELAGAKQRGRDGGPVLWHGAQRGVVALAERQLRVQRPRLRDKHGREVAVPAYDRLRDDANVGARVRDILVAGVSTRRYAAVLPAAAGTVGVSKSSVSRRFIEASAAQLAALNERSLADLAVLVIYIDGIVVSGHHIIAAVGVDEAGDKHLLGLALGASENAQVVKDLLRGMIARGLDASLSYLFVIDGGAALRSAIDEMFGQRAHVQRCRTHKLRNVLDRLPKTEAAQTKAVMMAAYKLEPKDGMAKMKKQAQWLEREHPDAAASLLQGLHETFTVNALGLPPTLMRCLCTTNIIENPNGIVRRTSRRVTRYRDANMALRWSAAGFLEAEKSRA